MVRTPKYRLHKPSGQAVVTVAGRDYYLGRHGTEGSREGYRQLLENLAAAQELARANVPTVAELHDRLSSPPMYPDHLPRPRGLAAAILAIEAKLEASAVRRNELRRGAGGTRRSASAR